MIAGIIVAAVVAVLIIAVCVRGIWENHALQCNPLTAEDEKLPAAFDGLRIAHISDLHNTRFGKDQQNGNGDMFHGYLNGCVTVQTF